MDLDIIHKAIALTQAPKVGPVTAKNLISFSGSINDIFTSKEKDLLKIPRVNQSILNGIKSKDNLLKAEKEIDFIQKHKIDVHLFYNNSYPQRLKQCGDAPVLLFTKGVSDFNASKIISIVGTRNITEYGKSMCKSLIEGLSKHNAIIVSGLAFGVDSFAHKSAIENNLETYAILGHSLDSIYPQENTTLAKKIIHHGALITEFSRSAPIDKSNFVRRNRIIAGMSDATIIIESATKGGSLITAEYANSYNRDVFAVPGRSTDKYSQGCNKLIKINKAAVVESISDIEYIMNWEQKKEVQKKLFIDISNEEQHIINLFSKDEKLSLDTICAQSSQKINKILTTLLDLEFKGMVKSYPGNMYGIS